MTGAPPWERPPQFGSAPDLDVGRDLGHVSSDAVDLILRMLRPFPGDRCTAQEALSHPWFKREERNRLSSPRYAPQLKLFQEKRKRRRDSAALDLTPMNRALPHIDKRGRSDDSKEPPLEYDTLSSDGSDYGGDELNARVARHNAVVSRRLVAAAHRVVGHVVLEGRRRVSYAGRLGLRPGGAAEGAVEGRRRARQRGERRPQVLEAAPPLRPEDVQ